MAAMGLCEEVYRLPMVPPRPASQDKILAVLKEFGLPVVDGAARVSDLAETHRAAVRAGRAARTRPTARDAFFELQRALERGEVRAAEPDAAAPSGWRVNAWVKQGILLGFRFGDIVDVSADHGRWPFYDKDTMPLKKPGLDAGVRIVPGGSTIREGAFVARSVVCMPPMYINIGAYVGEGIARRFARARRIVRADRQARAHQRRRADRRRDRAGRRAAGDRRRRRAGRRQHRRLRRRGHQAARGDRGRRRPHRIDADLRPAARARSSSRSRASRSSCPKARSSCPARAR